MTIANNFGPCLSNPNLATTDEFYCGTEYEIEDVRQIHLKGYEKGVSLNDECAYWCGDIGLMKDGSLRNNGIEFITRPVSFLRALQLFDELHENISLGPEPYTARTSTHVHVNAASMTENQVKHFILLYALFEPIFFKCTQNREHNIHCVPLSYTLLPQFYSASVGELVDRWSKYTAFNLLPLVNIGTIEFRHLQGTGDKQVYQQWLTLLQELWVFAKKADPTQLQAWLLSGTGYSWMRAMVIPSVGHITLTSEEESAALIDVKLAFV